MKKLFLILVLIASFWIPKVFQEWLYNTDYIDYRYVDHAYMKADITRIIICCIFWMVSLRLLHKKVNLNLHKDIIPVFGVYLCFILSILIVNITSYDKYTINHNNFIEFVNEQGYEFIFQALVLGGLGLNIYFNNQENEIKNRMQEILIISFILIMSYTFMVINDYNKHLLYEQKRNLINYYNSLYHVNTYYPHKEISNNLDIANKNLESFDDNAKTCNNNVIYKLVTLQSEILYNAGAKRQESKDGIRREYAYYTIDKKYEYLVQLIDHVQTTETKVYDAMDKQRVYLGIYFYAPFEREVFRILEDEVNYLEKELNVTIWR